MHSFAALHKETTPFVIPNAWDAASARLFEQAGFRAVATSSAGVAYSLGYADEGRVDVDETIAAFARMARAIEVPLSADIEDGWMQDRDALLGVVARVRDAGAVGINVEDWDAAKHSLRSLDEARDRVAAIKKRFGDNLFVNARTDVFLQNVGEPQARLDMTLERVRAFAEAGADGIFVPGVADATTIARIAQAGRLPLNVLAAPTTPLLFELAQLGVRRLSVGSWPMRRVMGLIRTIARQLHGGSFEFVRDAEIVPYAEANELFARPAIRP